MLRSHLVIAAFGAAICLTAISSASADPIQMAPQANKPDVFHKYPTTGIISPTALYTVARTNWLTSTIPLAFEPADLLQAEGNENAFVQTLNNFGGGWSFKFNPTATIADNTFQVHTYEAQAPAPPASNNLAYRTAADASFADAGCVKRNKCAGAEFYFHYNPTGDDPNNNVHWVQVIDNNGKFSVDVGLVVTVVNRKVKVVEAPYYDDGQHSADGTGFLDFPTYYDVTELTGPETFDAMLFLTTGPAIETPGLTTIYGGIDWGYTIQPVPVPAPLIGHGLPVLLAVGGILLGAKFLERSKNCSAGQPVATAGGSRNKG